MQHFIGLNIGSHDSSVALIKSEGDRPLDIEIVLSERISKKKHQGQFPFSALRQLKKNHTQILNELPENHVAVNSIGKSSIVTEVQYSSNFSQYGELIRLHNLQKFSSLSNDQISFITHHLCHAYSVLAQCPYEQGLIIVSDGMGNYNSAFSQSHEESSVIDSSIIQGYESMSIYLMDKGNIIPISKIFSKNRETLENGLTLKDGLGSLFESVSTLIFGNWEYSGKVMGLSAYGTPSKIEDRFDFINSLEKLDINDQIKKEEFDKLPIERFTTYANLAASVQVYFENYMLQLIKDLKIKYPKVENLLLVGGCALNCLLNARLVEEKIFSNVFVPAYPNDEGISLGAAIYLARKRGNWKFATTPFDKLTAALGDKGSDTENHESRVPELFKDYTVRFVLEIEKEVAEILNRGEIIAWIQGRSEVGPRALGHRSILVRPDKLNIKKILNETIKFREDFRPYGATILHEEVCNYFEVPQNFQSPFMTFAPKVRSGVKNRLQEITHLDGTVRIQTLHFESNPRFYLLIKNFMQLSGLPILLNTSLNVMGKPILETLEDAHEFFQITQIRTLVYGHYVITKD